MQQRLSASFKGYTAVTPHDWQTYEEMRNLALDKYSLSIDAIELSTQASGQSEPSLLVNEYAVCPVQSNEWRTFYGFTRVVMFHLCMAH